jgi:hypothetical protein
MQLDGLRYRFDGDLHAGEQVVSRLGRVSFEDDLPYLDSLANTLTLAQCFETVRDHPSFSPVSQARWVAGLRERVEHLNQPIYAADYGERLWLGALNAGAGIALENEAIFNAGVEVYRQAVRDDIRPDGYITRAVDDPALKGDGQSLYRQLLAVQALALTAEAASHAGVDPGNINIAASRLSQRRLT